MGNSDTEMTEPIIEAWADSTAQVYNDSLTGLELSRVPAAVGAYIELYAQSKTLTFNPEYAPTDYFEEHPATAIALILDAPGAVELLDDEEEEALEDILGFVEAWAEFDANQQPSLGVSEADADEDAEW